MNPEFTTASNLRLKEFLAAYGLKSTKQRDLVIETFLETKDHVDIDSIYKKVKEKNSRIGYATVYRTMKLLKESGIALERHFGARRHALYEPHVPNTHHDHLICVTCHKIVEFENNTIEKIQRLVAQKYRFKLTHHKHELYGYCEECKK